MSNGAAGAALFVDALLAHGTTAAVVAGTPTFVGLLGADSVSLTGSAQGVYNTKDVATANTVSFNGLTVSGADAGNYIISSSYSLPATITPAALTMTGLTVAASKVYDGDSSAVVGGAGVLVGVFGSDAVALNGAAVGTYNSKNVVSASEVAFEFRGRRVVRSVKADQPKAPEKKAPWFCLKSRAASPASSQP